MKKLNLAIIGQGRSGRDIHGAFYRSELNEKFVVRYVVEEDADRRARAASEYPGATVLTCYRELFGRADIDLVVNASYSDEHFAITKDLLEHGLSVMVEKPFSETREQCEILIETAKAHGVFLAVFQQTFFTEFYTHAKDVIASGKLGRVHSIELRYGCGFARRWDWQTLQKRVGGNAYNTGPHPIGLALGFLDFAPSSRVVYSRLGCAMTSGDAEDLVRILLTSDGGPLVDVEINSTDAYPKDTLRIEGTRGTYVSTVTGYKMTYYLDSENPAKPPVETFISTEEGLPAYCVEKLIKHEESGEFSSSPFTTAVAAFYDDVYFAMTEGRPLTITPKMAEEVIAVIEEAHKNSPLPRRF